MRRSFCVVLVLLLMAITAPLEAKPYRGAEYRTIASYTYGRFEVRMKSAALSGMLSSFFTYHEISSLADWNELDIEIMGRYSNEVQCNAITAWTTNHVSRQIVRFNPHAAFHVYAIEWTPDYVAWRVDGFEIYRQTGDHVQTVNRDQKLMMNIWQPADAFWAGTFDPRMLPVYAYYDWVKYYSYTPGSGDDFTLQWTDEMDAYNPARWQMASHTWDGNNSLFQPQNIVFKDGYMILCLTDSLHGGYAGGPIVDTDVDAPYVAGARGVGDTVEVRFSEPVEQASAENRSNYVIAGVTVQSSRLQADGRSVRLATNGLDPGIARTLIVYGIKDRAATPHTMPVQSIPLISPLRLPVLINVAGPASNSYLADSIWSEGKQYGSVGGAPIQMPSNYIVNGSNEPEIYRSALEGFSRYNVHLPSGRYDVTFLFNETKYTDAGKRIFSVSVNNRTDLANIDIVRLAGGNTACEQTVRNVSVTDNVLNIRFIPATDKPILSGLRIVPIADGVLERSSEPQAMKLVLYPNPFNPTVALRFSIGAAAATILTVHDLSGKEVDRKDLGLLSAGDHSMTWDGMRFPSGIYFFTVASGKQEITYKGVLLK